MRIFQTKEITSIRRNIMRRSIPCVSWNARRVILLITAAALILFSQYSSAASWRFNGVCYPDEAAALQAFVDHYPRFEAGRFYAVSGATINTSGLLTFRAVERPWTNATPVVLDGQTQYLAPCNGSSWENTSSAGLIFYGLLVLMFFIGVRMGFLL